MAEQAGAPQVGETFGGGASAVADEPFDRRVELAGLCSALRSDDVRSALGRGGAAAERVRWTQAPGRLAWQ